MQCVLGPWLVEMVVHAAFAGAEIAIMVPVIKVTVRMIEAIRFIIFIINLRKKPDILVSEKWLLYF